MENTMLYITIFFVLIIFSLIILFNKNNLPRGTPNILISAILAAFSVFALILGCLVTVDSGHVKVAKLFGDVQDDYYREGIHLVNPLLSFDEFDTRQKTHKESAGVPSEDKLVTWMDVSVQYRTIAEMTPDIVRNTGDTNSLIDVHLIPKLRSILREQGKGVKRSQDFFLESVQQQLQISLRDGLYEYLLDKGLMVEAVLIRDVSLPDVIVNSITETKKREQEVLKQEAELQRFAKEQEQKIAQSKAELEAAKIDAQKVKELADAEAYRIKVMNETLAKAPNYIELKRVERWNGILPVYAGGNSIPMIDIRSK